MASSEKVDQIVSKIFEMANVTPESAIAHDNTAHQVHLNVRDIKKCVEETFDQSPYPVVGVFSIPSSPESARESFNIAGRIRRAAQQIIRSAEAINDPRMPKRFHLSPEELKNKVPIQDLEELTKFMQNIPESRPISPEQLRDCVLGHL